MVKIDKSSRYKGKIFDDETEWKTGTDVFRQLLEDTRGKCYICEDNPSALNVDHIKPRSKCHAPKYARGWDNLLPACKDHCNTLKGNRYEHIINPAETDPENKIQLSLGFGSIVVKPCDHDSETLQTAELLNFVYNARDQKGERDLGATWRAKCRKLRGKIEANVKIFLTYIENVGDDAYDDLVWQEIDRSSPFAAFKRRIVRERSDLCSRFATVLT